VIAAEGGHLGAYDCHVKQSPAPVPARLGAIVKTPAPDRRHPIAETLVYSFVDLFFEDGHTERWIGPSTGDHFPDDPAPMAELVRWGQEVALLQADTLRADVEMVYENVSIADWQDLPVEIVVEWKHVDSGHGGEFSVGQYVELYPTIPDLSGGSIESGTRGIVQAIDAKREDGYLVAFLANEQLTGQTAWLMESALAPA
jgi:hypothetical protein